MQERALLVSSFIFVGAAIFHILRLIIGIEITVSGFTLPLLTSIPSAIVSSALAVWMFIASKRSFSSLVKVPKIITRSGVVLWVAASLSAVAILPYMLAMSPDALDNAVQKIGIPANAVIIISLAQSFILLGFVTFTGLWAAKKITPGTPLIDAVINNEPSPYNLKKLLPFVIFIALASVLLIVALELTVFRSWSDTLPQQLPEIAPWKGLLASFYGGIAEEIQLRLFLLSMIALALRFAIKVMSPQQNDLVGVSTKIFWTANILAATFFGFMHLPTAAEIMPLTPLFITRIVFLNGIIGLIAGVFFRRWGIELAIIFHFMVDILLHVVIPVLN